MYANDGGKWSGKTGGDSLVYVGVMKSYFLLSSSLSHSHALSYCGFYDQPTDCCLMQGPPEFKK